MHTIRSRIQVALKLQTGEKAKTHGNQTLTNAQELALVAIIKALGSMGIGATYRDLSEWCSDTFELQATPKVIKRVFKKFEKEIGMFKLSALEQERLDNRTIKKTYNCVDVAQETLRLVRADGANLINIDEAKASADDIAQAPLSGDKRAKRHSFVQPQPDNIRTLVMAVNGKGDVLVELRIFKDPAQSRTDKITLGGLRQGDREEWPVYYAVTDNGYMDSKLWLNLMERVVERHELLYAGLTPVLLWTTTRPTSSTVLYAFWWIRCGRFYSFHLIQRTSYNLLTMCALRVTSSWLRVLSADSLIATL